ncbi:MAG: ethanolamine ammonia-lyase subunit EutC [Negativicutes bacterium]
MAMEDNIRLIVEQVLTELAKNPQKTTGAECTPASPDTAVSGMENISDLAKVDLQRYLQVPNPVNKALYEEMKLSTPARIGVWRSGTRPLTDTWLRFRADHAVAQDSVLGEVPAEFPAKYNMVSVKTMCESKDEYLTRPDLGRKLDEASLNLIRAKCRKGAKLQIIIADGLSSKAVEANIPNLLPAMLQGLEGMGIDVGTPIFVQYARVAVMDAIGEELKPEAAIVLLGERPGLGTAESMSAYIGYQPRSGMVESERTVVSNIHKGGTPAAEAGAHLSTLLKKILDARASGVNLH